MPEFVARFSTMCAAFALTLALAACGDGLSPAITDLIQARQRAAEARVRFSRAVDASNRVVMSDSEGLSLKFAQRARAESNALERELAALEALLRGLDYEPELKLLDQAQVALARYRRLDREILTFSAENSNRKAQRLSFGPGHDAVTALRDALGPMLRSTSAKEACRTRMLAQTILSSARQIEALQAPHIAASKGEIMAELEEEMRSAETAAREAERELAGLDSVGTGPAKAALQRFLDRNREILVLSRRNSDVRSLELSLGEKQSLTQSCEQTLQELAEALAERPFPGTR